MVMDGEKPLPTAKKTRASKPKVKSGCKTCKLRGVKCDEEKPVCRRCISSGRVCDGYGIWGGGGNAYGSVTRAANLRTSKSLITYSVPSICSKFDQKEKMAFEYFRIRISIKLPGVFDSGFWETVVFQASSTEPAVLHALTALGAINLSKATQEGNGYSSSASPMGQYDHLALEQYNKAIVHLAVHFKKQSKESIRVALITCMVFICIELLRENFKIARAHLSNGLKLLGDMHSRKWSPPSNSLMARRDSEVADEYLIEAFTRLNIHSSLFGQGSSLLYTMGQDTSSGPDYEMPEVFETFRKARVCLDELMNGVYCLSDEIEEFYRIHHRVPKNLISRKDRLQGSLVLWRRTFDICFPSSAAPRNPRQALGIPMLRIYHSMTTIMASVCIRPGNEMIYDLHIDDFESIIQQATDVWKLALQEHNIVASPQNQNVLEPGFTIDMGFIPPLYYTAVKCRVPRLRREAINSLLFAPHREGLWDGVVAACIARRIMEIEEDDFYQDVETKNYPNFLTGFTWNVIDDAPLVPQFSRVHNASVILPDGIGSKAKLIYRRYGTESNSSWELKTAEIDLMFARVSSGDMNGCVSWRT